MSNSSESTATDVRTVQDVEAIRRLLSRQAHLRDVGPLDEWIQGYTEDGVYSAHGTVANGRAEILAIAEDLRARLWSDWRGSHFLSEPGIDVDSEAGTATGITHYTYLGPDQDGGYKVYVVGRYHDRFVRTEDGRWLLAAREILTAGNEFSAKPAGDAKPVGDEARTPAGDEPAEA